MTSHSRCAKDSASFACVRNICCVRDTKSVSDFFQKHFVSAINVSQFAQPKKHHGQQCVCNNVSSFARAFKYSMSDYGGRCGECLFSSKIGTKSFKDGSQDICEAKESNLQSVAGF